MLELLFDGANARARAIARPRARDRHRLRLPGGGAGAAGAAGRLGGAAQAAARQGARAPRADARDRPAPGVWRRHARPRAERAVRQRSSRPPAARVPQAWLEQLAVGGRLVAPMQSRGARQVLVVVDRSERRFTARVHEAVHFVPLKSGCRLKARHSLHAADRMSRRARAARRAGAAPRWLWSAARTAPTARRSKTARAAPRRRPPRRARADAGAAPPPTPAKPLPGAENAGKPGYYTVKPGDTLIRVGLETGQNWNDIARWNNIENPNVIEVGQVLRVVAAGRRSRRRDRAAVHDGEGRDAAARSRAAGSRAAPPAPRRRRRPSPPAPRRRPAAQPLRGRTAPRARRRRRRELDLARHRPGGRRRSTKRATRASRSPARPATRCSPRPMAASSMPARACAATATSSSSSTTTPTSPRTRTTRRCWSRKTRPCARGQKIAEMGSSDAERVQLHFEIRKQGKPIDPARGCCRRASAGPTRTGRPHARRGRSSSSTSSRFPHRWAAPGCARWTRHLDDAAVYEAEIPTARPAARATSTPLTCRRVLVISCAFRNADVLWCMPMRKRRRVTGPRVIPSLFNLIERHEPQLVSGNEPRLRPAGAALPRPAPRRGR